MNAPTGNERKPIERSMSSRETMAPSGLSDSTPTSSGPFAQLPMDFGRFRVLKLLGHGAMGTVYQAVDPELGREVALKIPKGDLAQDAVLWERFQREARAVGDLNHANICGMYEVGQIGATHYICMEYIDGRPLTDYISDGQAQRKVAGVIRKLAEALAHAHERGIVHRDLKPANVMIDVKSEPKLMDFGLARRLDLPSDVRATQSGMIVGSPAYMSPEQARAEHDKIGPRTDIYGLGVLFFEMLTGSLPFRGQMVVVLGQIATQLPPRPTSLRANVHPKLETLCLKMLAKKQQDRPQSMTEVVQILTDWLKSDSDSANDSASDANMMTIAKEEPLSPVKPSAAKTEKTDPIETQKQRVHDLLSKHRYAAAIELLDKIVNLNDARFEKLVAWGRERLPEVRGTDKKAREVSAPSCEFAEQLFKRYDYAGAVELLTLVPPVFRTFEVCNLIARASELRDECDQLQHDIEDAISIGDNARLPELVKSLKHRQPNALAVKQGAEYLQQNGFATAAFRSIGRGAGGTAERTNVRWQFAGSVTMVIGALVVASLMVKSYLADSPRSAALQSLDAASERSPQLLVVQEILPPQGVSTAETVRPNDTVSVEVADTPSQPPESVTPAELPEANPAITAAAVSQPPVMQSFFHRSVSVGDRVEFEVFASDADTLPDHLRYKTEGILPAGASFDETSHRFDWEVGTNQADTLVQLKFQVSDDSMPPLSDARSLNIRVQKMKAPPTVSNSIGMKFVEIPAGVMYLDEGSMTGVIGRNVRNSKPLLVGVTEVTQTQYQNLFNYNPSHFSRGGEGRVAGRQVAADELPVERVSWIDAANFCNRLSEKENLSPCYTMEWEPAVGRHKLKIKRNATTGYRMPTFEESRFVSFAGDKEILDLRGASLLEFAWTRENSNGRTHEAGTKKPNSFGIYDLYGNVWEYRDRPGAFGGGLAWAHPVADGMSRPTQSFNNGVEPKGSHTGFRVVRSP